MSSSEDVSPRSEKLREATASSNSWRVMTPSPLASISLKALSAASRICREEGSRLRRLLGDHHDALADLTRLLEIRPDNASARAMPRSHQR